MRSLQARRCTRSGSQHRTTRTRVGSVTLDEYEEGGGGANRPPKPSRVLNRGQSTEQPAQSYTDSLAMLLSSFLYSAFWLWLRWMRCALFRSQHTIRDLRKHPIHLTIDLNNCPDGAVLVESVARRFTLGLSTSMRTRWSTTRRFLLAKSDAPELSAKTFEGSHTFAINEGEGAGSSGFYVPDCTAPESVGYRSSLRCISPSSRSASSSSFHSPSSFGSMWTNTSSISGSWPIIETISLSIS